MPDEKMKLSLRRSPDHDHFVKSMKKWCTRDDVTADDLTRPISWDNGHPGLLALTHYRTIQVQQDIEFVFGLLESPIEVSMLFALAVVGSDKCGDVLYVKAGARTGTQSYSDNLSIEPQAQIGDYRVDFLVTLSEVIPDFEHERVLPGGHKIPGDKTVQSKIIVECDGHDFHDRTKEQASKDRERDRALQSFGYQVFRYTGADIWKDVFSCAEEAISLLVSDNEKAW